MEAYSEIVTVFVGVGSNCGDRTRNIMSAIERLRVHPEITVEKVSSFIETKPEGYRDQPDFLNGVIKLTTTLPPRALLTVTQEIECALGRKRTVRFGPRTIDLDILLYADRVFSDPCLTIPHPRMQKRDFVMRPLREIEPHIDTILSRVAVTYQ